MITHSLLGQFSPCIPPWESVVSRQESAVREKTCRDIFQDTVSVELTVHIQSFVRLRLTSMSRSVGCFFCRYARRVARIALNRDTIACESNTQQKKLLWFGECQQGFARTTQTDLVGLFYCSSRCTHLSIFVINKQIPHSLLLCVWDLQSVGMTDLLRLENRIQVLHWDDSFGSLSLGKRTL